MTKLTKDESEMLNKLTSLDEQAGKRTISNMNESDMADLEHLAHGRRHGFDLKHHDAIAQQVADHALLI